MASHRRRPFQRPPQSLRPPSRAENLPSSGTRVPMDEVRSSNQVLIDEMDSSNPVNVFGSISSDQAKQVHPDKNPSGPLATERSQTYNEEWQRLRRWAATCVAMYAAYAAILVSVYHRSNYLERSISNEGDYERHALMERLTLMDNEDCYNQLRMGKDAFARLVNILRGTGRLRNSAHSNVEEQVAKFLHIVGHNLRNRTMKFYFKRSSETVSRHFHQVLRAIISLDDVFLKQPDGLKCPQEIKENTKFWPYFKKHSLPLKEYSVHQPENAREVFNLRHSSLRNAIERAFGVLKKRFPIIASGMEPHYPVDTPSDIILACCILHNYLMGVDPNERLIADVDRELFSEEAEFESMVLSLAEKCKEGEILREKIAMDMWKDYNRNR
eukprot:XP_019076534.1 PREDICTED: uncharacterized protein LOC104879861 [Vitis vinifera]